MVRYSKSLARTSTVLDADRGQSTPQSKSAIPISLEDAAHREDDRAGL